MAVGGKTPKVGNRDEDEESDFGPGEEERAKNAKSADVGLPAAAALLSLRESDETSQSKDFFWDQAVKLLASGMLVLTLLEVLSSIRGEAVQCLTPESYTRDQGAFINAYCTQSTQRTDYFLFLLVAQALLVYGPHFLWSSVYFGKLRYFSALAFSLDRHRDSKTGEFRSKNFVTVRALMETFGSTRIIYVTYVAKLAAQLLVAVVFIIICATLFNEYDPAFDCPDDDSLHLINGSWPLDEQIVCVLSSLNVLFPVWWANFVLLVGTVVASMCGLVWCGLNHQTKLNWSYVARFALQSGIQPSYYRPKSLKKRWFSKYFLRYRIRSNLDFLFLRLYRDDVGRAQVLREVLIAQLIKEQEQRLQERLSFLRKVKDENMRKALLDEVEKERIRQKEPERCNFDEKRAQEKQDLGNTLESVLCNFLTNPIMNLEYINAVDISFGSSGFKMLIATMYDCDQVVSVNFDPHYLNEDHSFEMSSFLSEIESFRTWSTIFSKEKEDINMLRNEIAKQFFRKEQLEADDVRTLLRRGVVPAHQRANVVLVGPIPEAESQHVVTVHWLLNMLIEHKLVDDVCYLVTVTPCRVENEPVEFKEFEPAWAAVSRRNGTVASDDSDSADSDQSGSRQEDSNAHSNGNNSKTREIAYLMYDSSGLGGDSGKKEFTNHYKCAQNDGDVQRRNVLVECGSTLCEFEIKAYEIEQSSYVSHKQSPSPQDAGQSEHHRRTTEVEQGAEQSRPAQVQSCPQLYTGSNSQLHAQTSAQLLEVRSISEIRYDETRPQLRARSSSLLRALQSGSRLEENPSRGQLTPHSGSAPPGTLV